MRISKLTLKLVAALTLLTGFAQTASAISCGDAPPFCGHPLCPCPINGLKVSGTPSHELAYHSSALQNFELDASLGLSAVEAGTLSVQTRSVSMALFAKDNKGTFQVAHSVTLPITSVENDCGSVVITASQGTSELIVADHRQRVCKNFEPYKTSIIYEVNGVKSRLGGTELQPNLDR